MIHLHPPLILKTGMLEYADLSMRYFIFDIETQNIFQNVNSTDPTAHDISAVAA